MEIQGATEMLPDVIGAGVLAGEVLVLCVLVRIFVPTLGVAYWGWLLFYAVIAVAALLSWHSENRPAQPKHLMGLAVGSVVMGVLLFGADALVGSMHGSYHSIIEAASHSEGPFGFILTLIIGPVICPGITIFAAASAVRARYVTRKDSDI
ncbi:MAG: hypothetical protein ACLQBU_14235 [Terriglobales bacterium]